ncbi:MAG: hypothetical protein LBB04_00220 [Oscillospiraceae bacterium]|nr:hypothetical protein [Oscillospiraceae bacterium]
MKRLQARNRKWARRLNRPRRLLVSLRLLMRLPMDPTKKIDKKYAALTPCGLGGFAPASGGIYL